MAKYHALSDDADDAMANVLVSERGEAFTGVLNTLGELLLIAPEHIMLLADKAATILGAMNPDPAYFRDAREQLIWAMRADLGESAPNGS